MDAPILECSGVDGMTHLAARQSSPSHLARHKGLGWSRLAWATVVLLFLLPLQLFGQGKSVPLLVSLFNESTAIPFTRFFTTPIHPGLQVGTQFDYRRGAQARIFQTANLSYYYHAQLNHGMAAFTEFGYEFNHKSGLSLAAGMGVGYLHTVSIAKEYVGRDGQFVEGNDRGNSRLYPTLFLQLGYDVAKGSKSGPQLFLRYQPWVEFPYSPGFIPVMTHVNLHLGIQFPLTFPETQP